MTKALQLIGERMRAEEVISEVERDIPFYDASGGGMTLSGGEPLLQLDFCLALLKLAKGRGIHTCLDTSGYMPRSHFKVIVQYVDLFLFDFKGLDPAFNKKYTGANPNTIMNNLEYLMQGGAKVILRCPIIPRYTDSETHFREIAELERKYPSLVGIDIMGFHELGKGKYDRVGKEFHVRGVKSVSDEQKNEWIERLKALGCSKVKAG
jgi:pyruvate formate lyase activating enzyme